MIPIFLYGSLRDRGLLEIVLGRPVDPRHLQAAALGDHATRRARGADWPVLVAEPGAVARGVLLLDPGERDIARLAGYATRACSLVPVTVETASGLREARHLAAGGRHEATPEPWDFETWQRDCRPVAVEEAREYAQFVEAHPGVQTDAIRPGMRIRALQRVKAQADTPRLGAVRTPFAGSDFELQAVTPAYASFLAVHELRLRHRRFDGGWTASLDRTAVLWGDAVTLLPYDPRRDRVLLIEQFRAGPAARGDRNPWCIEVIAGRIDRDEDPEQAARREAREEAGLEIGRVVETGSYYPTPGLAAEYLTGFVGEADLADEGGLHGLHDEHEDIRTVALGFDAAMAAVGDGAVNTGPAVVALLWLAANRDRLRRDWAGI